MRALFLLPGNVNGSKQADYIERLTDLKVTTLTNTNPQQDEENYHKAQVSTISISIFLRCMEVEDIGPKCWVPGSVAPQNLKLL